jgi:hypothetical protein
VAQQRIVLVVGAGASKEFDLPTGKELAAKISEYLDISVKNGQRVGGDERLLGAIHKHAGNANLNAYLKAARSTSAAMPLVRSIDEYLDLHAADQLIEICGKLAITRLVLEAEKNSTLHSDRPGNVFPDFSKSTSTWLNQFWLTLVSRCRFDQLPSRLSSCSLIVFNYDRCIEHFLYHAIQRVYRVKGEEAAAVLRHLRVFHPYGTVGRLPWQSGTGEAIEFGGEVEDAQLNELRMGIRTYSEKLGEQKELGLIREAVFEAHVMVFLGFAFHPDNMALITPQDQPDAAHTTIFYATLLGESESNATIVKQRIRALRRLRPSDHTYFVKDLTCAKLFEYYSKSLEFV